ncbi:MAG TPA: HAMP domain-containing sensor histidine kinase [Opitutaceae bacterium]|nr:HAMP domain-containing sensor histidine kinase [Opitutaceae bacterium]
MLADATLVPEATRMMDGNGLPRWAVVVIGRDATDLAETVPPEEWDARRLARIFRSALGQHELLCENFRLRGDLKTIARRFSHDLYMPVGCIKTSSGVLKILPTNEAQSMTEMIQSIEDSAAEIVELTERVCLVLRATADPSPLVEVEMGEVIAAVLSRLTPDIRKAGATVVSPPSWPKVMGAPKWLQAIWWNLLHNALKHGGPAVQVRIEWSPEAEGHCFSVTDNGAGVAPAVEAKLFRPFDQLHSLHTPGLGLSITQRLIALQGGICGYEKTPEGGASFYFTLPAARA